MKQPASEDAFPLDFGRLERLRRSIDALVLPQGFDSAATADRESPIFPVPPEGLEHAWRDVIGHQERVAVLRSDAARRQVLVRERSPVFGFPDFAWIEFHAAGPNQSAIALYSRSRFGLIDMGVNRKRVDRWIELLQPGPSA